MPIYTYQCYDCGFRFEKSRKASLQKIETLCTSCGEEAEQMVPEGISVGFDLEVKGNIPTPQNTGVSSFDYDFDQIIGKSAQQNYKMMDKRDAYKREIVRDNPGSTKRKLARTVDGDYLVVSQDHVNEGARKRAVGEALRIKAFLNEDE